MYITGAGSNMFTEGETAKEVISLSGKFHPSILYIGTCSYEDPRTRYKHIFQFRKLGCPIDTLNLTNLQPGVDEMTQKLKNADVILVSGGNTLWGYARWRQVGFDWLVKRAVCDWGKVWAGGSSGMILASNSGVNEKGLPLPGLGILNVIGCPHYNEIDSRITWVKKGETGLALEDWGGIMICGNRYKTVRRRFKKSDAYIVQTNTRRLIPTHGSLRDIGITIPHPTSSSRVRKKDRWGGMNSSTTCLTEHLTAFRLM